MSVLDVYIFACNFFVHDEMVKSQNMQFQSRLGFWGSAITLP